MSTLTVLGGPQGGEVFTFEGECDIGRAPNVAVRFQEPTISRQHARIRRQAWGFEIEHLGLSSATYVNGAQVEGTAELKDGDVIRLGPISMRFDADPTPLADEDRTSLLGIPGAVTMVSDQPGSKPEIVQTVRADSSLVEQGGRRQDQGELEKVTAALLTLNGLSKGLAQILDATELLQEIPARVLGLFPDGARAALLLKEPDGSRLIPRATKRAKGSDKGEIKVSNTILDHVVQKREAVLSLDAQMDSRFQHGKSVQALGARSIMCAPLVWRDEVVGALCVDADRLGAFSRIDLQLLNGIADQCAVALGVSSLHAEIAKRQRLAHDLQLAERIQRSFLPSEPPQLPGYGFAVSYTAAEQIGGDFYDFIPLPRNRLGIVVADISGKGISAALHMARFSRDLRFFTVAEPDPIAVLAQMNRAVLEAGRDNMFVTMIFVTLDLISGIATVANAGHMPPIIQNARGEVEHHDDVSGLPLGILPDAEYTSHRFDLDHGDTMLLFSDGLNEAMSPTRELFGMKRLSEALASGPPRPKAIVERMLAAIKRHARGAPASDDTTLVCVGRDPDRGAEDSP